MTDTISVNGNQDSQPSASTLLEGGEKVERLGEGMTELPVLVEPSPVVVDAATPVQQPDPVLDSQPMPVSEQEPLPVRSLTQTLLFRPFLFSSSLVSLLSRSFIITFSVQKC